MAEKKKKRQAKSRKAAVVKSLFIGFLIAFLEVLSNTLDLNKDDKTFALTCILLFQTVLSAYVGFRYLPQIFGNDELRQYQDTVLSAVLSILAVTNKASVGFVISDALQRIIGKIDSETITDAIETQADNVKSFFTTVEETGVIDTAPLRERISHLIETGPDPIEHDTQIVHRTESDSGAGDVASEEEKPTGSQQPQPEGAD